MVAPIVSVRAQEATPPADQAVVLVDAPQSGALRRIAGDVGAAYMTVSDEVDSFSFAATSDSGVTLFDVTFDPLLGVVSIDSTSADGPSVACVFVTPIELVVRDDADATGGATDRTSFGDGKKGGSSDSSKKPGSPPPTQQPVRGRGGYILEIYVDMPGDGFNHGLIQGCSAGHAFIVLIDGQRDTGLHAGLGPAAGTYPLTFLPVAGVIQNDHGHDWEVRIRIELTRAEYLLLLRRLRRDIRCPPRYDLNDHNCVDYVIEIARMVGVQLSPPTNPWIGGNTPQNLGNLLLELGGDVNSAHTK